MFKNQLFSKLHQKYMKIDKIVAYEWHGILLFVLKIRKKNNNCNETLKYLGVFECDFYLFVNEISDLKELFDCGSEETEGVND
jgi:hypothetical protein